MTNKSADTIPQGSSNPRSHSKIDRLLRLLTTRTGASLDDMIEATGWQPHSVRAAMSGLRKRGFEITRHIEGNTTVWAVAQTDPEILA